MRCRDGEADEGRGGERGGEMRGPAGGGRGFGGHFRARTGWVLWVEKATGKEDLIELKVSLVKRARDYIVEVNNANRDKSCRGGSKNF